MKGAPWQNLPLVDRAPPFAPAYLSHGSEGVESPPVAARLVAGYVLRNKTIHLLMQIEDIRVDPSGQRADAVLFIGMAGQPAEDSATLLALRADLFRFDLKLVLEEGDWRIVGGRWQRASPSDF